MACAGARGLVTVTGPHVPGEGLMHWAPDGRNIIAKWDFVVEND